MPKKLKKVAIGTGNLYKVTAIMTTLQEMFPTSDFVVVNFPVSSGVSEQPEGMEETFQGAVNRLKAIREKFPDADLYISSEAGLVHFFEGHEGNIQTCVVETADGKKSYGISGGYEVPGKWLEMAREDGMAAVFAERFGPDNGGTRPLTNNYYTRKALIGQAVRMAMYGLNWEEE